MRVRMCELKFILDANLSDAVWVMDELCERGSTRFRTRFLMMCVMCVLCFVRVKLEGDDHY